MSEAVKRYVIRHGCVEEASSLLPGERAFVLAADHDRIVSSLSEAGRKMQAERDQLAKRCRDLLFNVRIERYEARRMRKDAERYQYLRRLEPAQFCELWLQNTKTAKPFDALVDAALEVSR